MQTFRLLVLLGLITAFSSAHTLNPAGDKTRWISLEQATDSLKKEKRPVLIDLYTDWCGWCKVMDRKTYSNKNVINYLSQKFYTVKVNAESRSAFQWNGKTYQFNQRYRTNDFAIFLTQGQLSYPTTVIIPADGSEPQAIPGFFEPKEFEAILKYFGEGHYGKTPFDVYHRSFKTSW